MNDKTINSDVTMGGSEGTLLANRYRVIRQLGQGGMGSVWLAADTQLDNREVAIKMLPSILVSNKRAYQQLKTEALVSLKLTHPNIAAVRAFEENGGNPFLVVDYIDGQTLDDYLADKGKLSEDETIRLLGPIASALDYAHGEGVVHRDVKPGNVMIRKDGHPFILDFGIAREIQETMTRVTGKLSSGTLMYMSPEQLHGAAPKASQDVYSFAAMAYECLMGTPPFSRGQIEYQIEHDSPAPIDPQFAKCGAGIMAGLAKSPEDRPPNCVAVLTVGGGHGVAALPRSNGLTAASMRSPRVDGASRKPRHWPVVVSLLFAILAGIGLTLGWFIYEDRREEAAARECERIRTFRRLAETKASEVDGLWKIVTREQYAELSGLRAKTKELESHRNEGCRVMSSERWEDWIAATNHFHLAQECGAWLASNAVLRAKCVESMNAAAEKRKAAEICDAATLSSNEFAKAEASFARATNEMEHAHFSEAELVFVCSGDEYDQVAESAREERDRLEREAKEKSLADEMRKSAVEVLRELDNVDAADGFEAKITAVQQTFELADGKYARREWLSARESFSNVVGECVQLQKLDGLRNDAKKARSEAEAALGVARNLGAETYPMSNDTIETGKGELERGKINFAEMRFSDAIVNFNAAARCFEGAQETARRLKESEENQQRECERKLTNDISAEHQKCVQARSSAVSEEASVFAVSEWQLAERLFQSATKVTAAERIYYYRKCRKAYEDATRVARQCSKPHIYLTASLNGEQKAATVTSGLAEDGVKTPVNVNVVQQIGETCAFEVFYVENGIPYRGKTECRIRKGRMNVNVTLSDHGLRDRPSSMNYCNWCGRSLSEFRKVGVNCPKCGGELKWKQ